MEKRIKKGLLRSIIYPIVTTEGKLEDKAEFIFKCLISNGIVSDTNRSCFLTEFFKHINQINDNVTNVFDRALIKALEKLNISIEEDAEEDQNQKNP